MSISRRRGATGFVMLCASIAISGCNTYHVQRVTSNTSNAMHQTVHTNQLGIPISPYVYEKWNATVVAMDSWNQPGSAFGPSGRMIMGKHQQGWVPLSMVRQSLKDAGIPTNLGKQTLHIRVPSSIPVGSISTSEQSAAKGTSEAGGLSIAINGQVDANLPKLTTAKQSYVPISRLLTALQPVGIKMRWTPATQKAPAAWTIGSPIYGTVTTMTTFKAGHAWSKRSAMMILHSGNNWIPYDYIASSLDNAQAGITVATIGNFAGLNIKVPQTISVNLKQLPSKHSVSKNEVPIKINDHVVGYAHSMVPTFGPQTGYLSSAEVMRAINRIGLDMSWNHSDGTFTQWNITEPKRQPHA